MFSLKEKLYNGLSPIREIQITDDNIYAFDNSANYYTFDYTNNVQRGQLNGNAKISAICSKYMAMRSWKPSGRIMLLMDWETENVEQIECGIKFTNLCFTPDSTKIVVWNYEHGIIKIYSTTSKKVIRQIEPEGNHRGFVMITHMSTTNTSCMSFSYSMANYNFYTLSGEENNLQVIRFNSPRFDKKYDINFMSRRTPVTLDDNKLLVNCTDDTVKFLNWDEEGLKTQNMLESDNVIFMTHYNSTVLICLDNHVSLFKFENDKLKHLYNVPGQITYAVMYGSMLVYCSNVTSLLNKRLLYDINDSEGKKILQNIEINSLLQLVEEDQINAVRYVMSHYIDNVLNNFRVRPLKDIPVKTKFIDPELVRFLNILINKANGKTKLFLAQYKALVESETFPAHLTEFIAPWLVQLRY